jgi:hypothetical protein
LSGGAFSRSTPTGQRAAFVNGLGRLMLAACSTSQSEVRREWMRDTREHVVSLVGFLLFVAMAVAIIVAVMTH